ncbi:4Fe-4S binding protein [Alistipes sp. An66]|uniref:4Fe-4S binding protein n=1 Tax=Alistipes sp. An66 TaxID=1965650 RepID=UPI000B3941EA|nr:4Fe-4S binding protein [Alistipes sp. An66]OUN58290.1 ferredoxin [Alistipes sp. An66]
MLRKIRIALAILFFVPITLLFLDFTGTIHAWFGWMAKIQFLPAVLALNVGVVAGLLLLTLLFGRVYCSVVCPLGVMQDLVSWLSGRRRRHRNHFRYSPARTWLRWGVFLLFVVVMAAGLGSIGALIAPYSAYGRIVQSLLAPLWGWGNNLLAWAAERVDSYAFYSVDVWVKGLATLVVAIVTFVVIAVLAWRNGRTWCNTVCPVGTLLGLLSRFSLFKPRFDVAKCNGCKLCARNCKASCIDPEAHTIDYSRCVACMDCLEHCRQGAISYTWRRSEAAVTPNPAEKSGEAPADASRRRFLGVVGLMVGTALHAQEKKVDGGLALIEEKRIPKRATPLVPPGARSLRDFLTHCTACQLCVTVCPNRVLRPSGDLMRLMKPEMSYERGYCRPECTKCSEVCPTNAIHLTEFCEKSSIQIGHAVWIPENCVVNTDGVSCNNCERHCPVAAIRMVPRNPDDPQSPRIPTVDEARCIGCGACENLCPARPFSAIVVEGHEHHRTL